MTMLGGGNRRVKVIQNGGCISTGRIEAMKLPKGHEIEGHSPMAFDSYIRLEV